MALMTESFLLDVFAVTISLLAVLVAFYKWSFTYWKRLGVYTATPSIPFGNATPLVLQKKTFGVEMQNVYADIKSKHKPYGGYYFFGKAIFIPVDLDLIKHIFTKDFVHFTDHVNQADEEVDPISGNLFFMKGLKWKHLRAKLTPTFTSGKMKMMFQILIDVSNSLKLVMDKTIEEKVPIDIKDIVGRFTTDIIGSCAFGLECNTLKNGDSEFREYGKKAIEGSIYDSVIRLLMFTAPELLRLLKLRTFRKDVGDFFLNIVKQTVNYREQNNITRKDFMHLLIQLKNNIQIKENDIGGVKNNDETNGNDIKSDTALSMNEVAAQAFVFFVAGFETSSTATTFCLYELVQNQKLQEKVREEINTVLDKHQGQITYDAITEMTYLEQCIDETLRKYPPIPVHTRVCTQTYHVPNSDLILPVGSAVFIPIMGIQYDPEHYPDPEKFDPDRFCEENKAARHSAAWTPFGDGPRACIGLRFGIMQTKVALATLLINYKFTLNPKTKTPLVMDPRGFVLAAKDGIWLNAETINNNNNLLKK